MLCWLFDQYDFDLESVLVFICWELVVFHLTRYLGLELENNDIVFFGLYPILVVHVISREGSSLLDLVTWVSRSLTGSVCFNRLNLWLCKDLVPLLVCGHSCLQMAHRWPSICSYGGAMAEATAQHHNHSDEFPDFDDIDHASDFLTPNVASQCSTCADIHNARHRQRRVSW